MKNKPAGQDSQNSSAGLQRLSETRDTGADEDSMLEFVAARREALRQRQLLYEKEESLKANESGLVLKLSAPLRWLPLLRPHLKSLLLLGLLGLISLPLWPALLLAMLFPRGRAVIWSVLCRAPRLLDVLMLLKSKLTFLPSSAMVDADGSTPLIYQRPGEDAGSQAFERAQNVALLMQLSPQKRAQLVKGNIVHSGLVSEREDPSFVSLASTELSLLQLYARSVQSKPRVDSSQ